MNKRSILALAKHSGLFWLSRRLTRRAVRILCYHGVWIGDGHFGDRLYMSPASFAARMRDLAASGYRVVGLAEALERQRLGTLPACATVITVDDGWYGCYPHMFPVLRELGLPSTLYVTSYYAEKQTPVFNVVVRYLLETAPKRALSLADMGVPFGDESPTFDLDDAAQREAAQDAIVEHGDGALDNDGRVALCHALGNALNVDFQSIVDRRVFHIMSAAELGDIARDGVDIQLHTHRHRISHEGVSSLGEELGENRAWLRPFERVPLNHFCYPSGIYERSCFAELERHGVESATTTAPGLNFPGAERFALARILDGESVEWIEIEAELSGFLELVRQLRRLLGRAPATA